jgi:hypothetical protein
MITSKNLLLASAGGFAFGALAYWFSTRRSEKPAEVVVKNRPITVPAPKPEPGIEVPKRRILSGQWESDRVLLAFKADELEKAGAHERAEELRSLAAVLQTTKKNFYARKASDGLSLADRAEALLAAGPGT